VRPIASVLRRSDMSGANQQGMQREAAAGAAWRASGHDLAILIDAKGLR
jgi:hypothetical protein